MPCYKLYYSESLLGHFTIIAYDRVELIANRIHFVDRGAEAAHQGKFRWMTHKLKQVAGYAIGEVLSDFESNPPGFGRLTNYERTGRVCIKQGEINVSRLDCMLNWVKGIVSAQQGGQYGGYGYVIYSDSVNNCGSFAIKCLERAGVSINLPYLKQWLQLPALIKDDVG